MTEWLANIKIEYVVAAAIVLGILRLILGRQKTPFAKSAAEIVESALIAIVLVFLIIRPFVVQAFFIPSESMLPTLEVHDHILVNKFIYRFREPQYGEVIVFRAPPHASDDGVEKDFIKRLVGKPGDTLEVEDGILYRNGEPIDEEYVRDVYIFHDMDEFKVPEGTLFVMGDNRNNSRDSREWGPLERNRVLGKAMVKFWPPSRMGVVR